MEKFKSRPNEFVTKDNIGDRGFWIPRSCAVVAVIIVNKNNKKYVLMDKRGPGTPDFQGYWSMPCGYLDWDESATEGAYREVWEETGLDLEKFINDVKKHYHSFVIKENLDQPWYVNHYKDSNRQNVTLRFGVEVQLLEDFELPELTSENCEPGEVDDLKWIDVTEVDNLKCAFGHDQVLKNYLNRQ